MFNAKKFQETLESYGRSKAIKRFKRSKSAVFGAGITIGFIMMAIFSPIIAPRNPEKLTPNAHLLPPGSEFFFGTDNIGRDIFSWFVWGARTSLTVGLGAVIIELIIGCCLGMVAGFFGGWIDNLLMRITDIMLCLPGIIMIIVASAMFEVRSIYIIMIIMGVLGWPTVARVVRAQFLSLKELSNVEAAKAIGASNLRIILRHIFPSTIPVLVVLATLDIPSYILQESSLTFLGLGDPTSVSWGLMANFGKPFLRSAPWITTFPGIAIFISTIGFNLFGDGLRDALDIRLK
jgi:ABC-type dipeptide/oligopeptide/nickel transport system permease subunit